MEHSQGSGHVIGNRSGDTADYDDLEAHDRLHRQLLDRAERVARERDETTVRIEYTVPLSVVVNVAEQTVEKIVVEDECLDTADPQAVWLAGSGAQLPPGDARARAALKVLDSDAAWPAWEFGW
jgi:hypothetical protein